MQNIKVEHKLSQEELDRRGVSSWAVWSKEISEFPWTYASQEEFYLLEGHVIITPQKGEAVEINAGDFVTCPAGLSCTWQVLSPVRKHYRFA